MKQKGEMKKENGNGNQNKKYNSRFPLIFLGIVAGIYCIVAILDITVAIQALNAFFDVLRQIIPVLVLVFVLMFLVNLFIKPKAIAKHLGSKSGRTGWIIAIIAGIIATGPVYVWYSMLADFREKGMRTALAGVFLYTRSVKLPFIPVMIYYFGGLYTAVLTTYLIVFSVLTGIVCEVAEGKEETPVPKDKHPE
ncbi:hypothetical protein L0665_09130 [Methanogenium marinum]|uniref:Permease n=1 Tax=Methanogenium marinum TaxID=348610 RepID=A0A9Q4KUU1_9EURY|nr:hypothetical protein [Methanogenium marinum]MDE4908768.1 hypothetical protein [Methanogenium marinum]